MFIKTSASYKPIYMLIQTQTLAVFHKYSLQDILVIFYMHFLNDKYNLYMHFLYNDVGR